MRTLTAIACAALFAAAAGQASAQDEANPAALRASASYADLDLTRAGGRATLERRIETAIERICPGRASPGELKTLPIGQKCRAQAWTGAQQQLAAVYDGRALAQASIEVGPEKR